MVHICTHFIFENEHRKKFKFIRRTRRPLFVNNTLQILRGVDYLSKVKDVYRVTRRVFSKPVTSKLHLLYTKKLAGHLKTPKVIRISALEYFLKSVTNPLFGQTLFITSKFDE